MKKTLAVIFYIGNINKGFNADKIIIDVNNYLDKKKLIKNKNLIDQKDSNIEPMNPNTRKSLEDQFANVYKKWVNPGYYQCKCEKITKTATKNPEISWVSYERLGGKK